MGRLNNIYKLKPVVLVTALTLESNAILEKVTHKNLFKDKQIKLYELECNSIYLMEIGKGFRTQHAIIISLLKKLNCKFLINYGFCGALDPGIMPSQFFFIKEIITKGREKIDVFSRFSGFEKKFFFNFESKSLLTVTSPVLKEKLRNTYYEQTGCSLVDMEAYKIAKIANGLSLPILFFKMVSDLANEPSEKVVKDRMTDWKPLLSSNMFEVLRVLNIHL